jgi:hypothetical protein
LYACGALGPGCGRSSIQIVWGALSLHPLIVQLINRPDIGSSMIDDETERAAAM